METKLGVSVSEQRAQIEPRADLATATHWIDLGALVRASELQATSYGAAAATAAATRRDWHLAARASSQTRKHTHTHAD